MEKDFFQRVYDVAEQIPFGRVTSYGAIAVFLGAARSARMVGWAMNNSSTCGRNIPAHRVVNRKGLLTGKNHFGNTDTMSQLLEAEGITIVDDQIIDFDKLFWDPAMELTR